MELGEKIRTARVERSMTLADLAAATNLTKGFCYVLSGEALFEQNGVELTLSQGDALSWNAGSPYTMQNRQRAPLSLLLSIGAQGVLPTVREPAPAIADRSQYAPDPRFSEGGPMRLVAMRAHRRATRSG